jgi:hypothetical protein
MKKLFFIILLTSILSPLSFSQWWVSGGNLLWTYGDVSINKNLNVEGAVNGSKQYIFLFSYSSGFSTLNVIDLFNNIGTNSSWERVSTGLFRTTFNDVTFDENRTLNTHSVAIDLNDRQMHYFTYVSGEYLYLQINKFDLTFYDPDITNLPITLIYYP